MHWEILFVRVILFTELLLEWEVDRNLFTLYRLARRGDQNEDRDSRCGQGDTRPPSLLQIHIVNIYLLTELGTDGFIYDLFRSSILKRRCGVGGAGGRKGLKLTSFWNPNGFSVQTDRECVWNQSSKRKDIGTISALVQFCSSTLKKHK